jgi:hypothetical protein
MTSIEFFAEKDTQLTIDFLENKLTQLQLAIAKTKLFHEAKEMHKQEMKDAFTEGEFNIHNSKRDEGFEYETSEQYYQETFKKEQL